MTIIFLTFFKQPLPYPVNEHFHVGGYYYYSIPISLIIALIFLNYFALTFGVESRIRKEALNKMEEIMSKEHELLSLGGQAAAAAHSLGTPFSTIKIICSDLLKQFKDNNEVKKDIDLLMSQMERCSIILKKLKKDLQFPLLNKLSNLVVKYQLTKKEKLFYLIVVYFY